MPQAKQDGLADDSRHARHSCSGKRVLLYPGAYSQYCAGFKSGRIFEISVNLNPKFRGKKLSTFLIDLSIAHFNKLWGEEVQGIVAEIKPSNIGSRKCFTRAGFKLLKESGNEIDSNKEQCQKYYRKL